MLIITCKQLMIKESSVNSVKMLFSGKEFDYKGGSLKTRGFKFIVY